MNLNIMLPSEDSGRIEIIHLVKEDSIVNITTESFKGQVIDVQVSLRKKVFKNNPVLKYIIYTHKNTYESTFAGETGLIKINIEPQTSLYPKKSKYYNLTQLVNNFKGDTFTRLQIIKEIVELYDKYPQADYTKFIIYNTVKNNLILLEELKDKIKIDNDNSYWIKKLKQHLVLKNQVAGDYFKLLSKYCDDYEYVLIKFWATWCRPCIEDNKTIEKMKTTGEFKPFVLGVQIDAEKVQSNYDNISDSEKIIPSYYNITAYPTYQLYHNREMILQSNSLDEVIKILNE